MDWIELNSLWRRIECLYKLYNSQSPEMDWIELNFNQTLTLRQTHFTILKSNNFAVGNNLFSARLSILNSKIPLIDLNLSLDSFKVKCKKTLVHQSIMSSYIYQSNCIPINPNKATRWWLVQWSTLHNKFNVTNNHNYAVFIIKFLFSAKIYITCYLPSKFYIGCTHRLVLEYIA